MRKTETCIEEYANVFPQPVGDEAKVALQGKRGLLNECGDMGDGVAVVVRAQRGLSVTDKGLLCLKQVVSTWEACLLSG